MSMTFMEPGRGEKKTVLQQKDQVLSARDPDQEARLSLLFEYSFSNAALISS